jgi:hypothetical protein
MDVLDVVWWMIVAATVPPALRVARREGPATFVAFWAAAAVAGALVVVAARAPQSFAALNQEDGVVEWATFWSFLLAAVLFVRGLKAEGSDRVAQVFRLLVALFCVVVAGEEISWAQRLLAFQPPDAFLERNFQQELNLHNVLMDKRGLGVSIDSKMMVMAIAMLNGLVLPALSSWQPLSRFQRVAPSWSLLPLFLAVVAAEWSYPIDLTGESAELLLGLAFVAQAASTTRAPSSAASLSSTQARPLLRLALMATPLVLGALTAPLLMRLVYGDDEAGRATARAELVRLAKDVQALQTSKLRNKGSVHKRVFTATVDGYLEPAGGLFLDGKASPADEGDGQGVRRDRFGYFLDPWNNPYWLYAERKTGRQVVYSFGPNRRRDHDPRRDDIGGDDVIVLVSALSDALEDAAPAEPSNADPQTPAPSSAP